MNNYGYEEEREIDLRDLIMYILLRWRSILIVALLGALLGGAYSYARSNATATAKTIVAEAETVEVQSTEILSGTEAAVAGMEQLIERTSKYILTAPMMQIDPYHTAVCSGILRVKFPASSEAKILPDTAGRYAGDLIREVWDSTEISKLADKLQTDTSYIGELITLKVLESNVQDSSSQTLETMLDELSHTSYIEITAIGTDAKMAQDIYDAVVKALMSVDSIHTEVQPELKASKATSSFGVRTDIQQKQNSTFYLLKDYNDRLTNLNTTLTKVQNDSEETVSQSGGGHVSKKYVLLGFVGAGFLICCFYLLRYILQDLLRTESHLKDVMNIKILGHFVPLPVRKPFDFIDQLIRKIGGALKPVPEEETFRMVETNIKNYAGTGKKLLITGSGAAVNYERIAAKIKELLGDDFTCTISSDILHSVEARQALAACDGVVLIEELNKSKYLAVGEEAKLIRSMNKEIVGGVLA